MEYKSSNLKLFHTFSTANRILYGIGSIEKIPVFITEWQVTKILLLVDCGVHRSGIDERPLQILSKLKVRVDILNELNPEPTVDSVEELTAQIAGTRYDMIMAIGGGSTMDMAKLVAVLLTNEESLVDLIGQNRIRKSGIPTLLIPTSAGTGSEVTPNAIVVDVDNKVKTGVVSRYLLAKGAILDPVMTEGLPPDLTASTGMDAFIHSLESYCSKKANPLSDAFAIRSMSLILRSIKKAYSKGNDMQARYDMLIGSSLGGMALSCSGTGAVHALSYPLGGAYGIPHGIANSILLVPVLEYNLNTIEERISYLYDIIVPLEHKIKRTEQSAGSKAYAFLEYLRTVLVDLRIPKTLKRYKINSANLDEIAKTALNVRRLIDNNPKEIGFDEIRKIYTSLI
jgi:alcohol dehydrogenase class IV